MKLHELQSLIEVIMEHEMLDYFLEKTTLELKPGNNLVLTFDDMNEQDIEYILK